MNRFTKKKQFLHTANYILNNSDLLVKEDCMIVDGVLYERLTDSPAKNEENYRFYFSTDDYDYLQSKKMVKILDKLFKMREKRK